MRYPLLSTLWLLTGLLSLHAQPETGDALRARADALWEAEQPTESAATYLRAARAYLQVGDTVAAFDNGLEAALTYEVIEDYATATTALRQTLDFSPGGSPPVDSLRALAWHKLGVTYYYRDDYPAATAAYQRALALRSRLFDRTHPDRIKTRRNLAYAYYYGTEYDSAIYHLQIVIRDNRDRTDPDLGMLSSAYSILGNAYANIRDVQNGRAAVLAGIAIDRELWRDDPGRLGNSYYNAARYFAIIEDGEEAVRYADRAIEQYRTAGSALDAADALQAKGLAEIFLERYDQAAATLNEALAIYRREDAPTADRAYLLFNLALANYRRDDAPTALALIDRAYAIVRSTGDSVEIGTTLHPKAVYHGAVGQPELARQYFREALAYLAPDYDADRPAASIADDRRIAVAELLADWAEFTLRTDDPSAAIRRYEETATQLELIRTRFTADDSRQFISERAQPVFAALTRLYADRYATSGNPAAAATAFRYSERSKAYNLLQALDRQRRDGLVPDDWRRRETAYSREVAELNRRLRTDPQPADQRRLATLELGLQQLRDSIRSRTGRGDQEPLDLSGLQRWLADEERELIAYSLLDSTLLLFHLTGEELRLHRIDDIDALRDDIEALRRHLAASAYADVSLRDPVEQRRLDADYTRLARALYERLLGPAGSIGPQLVIVPDGVLGYLPFDALLQDAAGAGTAYAELGYFGLAHRLQYSYSAAYLLQLAATRVSLAQRGQVLAFAPAFGATDAQRMSADRAALLPLAFNQPEVLAIADILPTELRVGAAATRAEFIDLAEAYACLHLSSHAVVDADDPDFSYIAFTQTADSLDPTQLLYLNDLYALRLPADLAVLSACETSMGRIAPGEGVLSLARAFAYAGARATTTTLWNVNDRATKELIVAYYAELKAGYEKPEALWRAKRQLVAEGEYAHPYYWSGLVLYGDAAPLELPGLGYGWWWTIGLLLLGAGVLVWQLYRMRGNRD